MNNLTLDFCAALEFEGHSSVGVDSYRVDDGQPEFFIKFGEDTQFLHLEHECANGIRLGLPFGFYAT